MIDNKFILGPLWNAGRGLNTERNMGALHLIYTVKIL